MKNVTITLEEDVARWARIRAAELNTSMSRLLGEMLRQMMQEEEGYHAAMRANLVVALGRRLEKVDPDLRGFAYEGAAMALTLRDAMSIRRGRRLQDFLRDLADRHVYTAHVGAGWA